MAETRASNESCSTMPSDDFMTTDATACGTWCKIDRFLREHPGGAACGGDPGPAWIHYLSDLRRRSHRPSLRQTQTRHVAPPRRVEQKEGEAREGRQGTNR